MENETIKYVGYKTPKTLFQVDIVYKIPYYQRAYVWDKQNQWIPLWEDIKMQAERHLIAKKQNVSLPAAHFMGALVQQEMDSGDADILMRAVVDGQQRLITTQILLAAIRTVMQEKNYETLAKKIQNLTKNKEEYTTEYAARNGNNEMTYKVAPSRAEEKSYKIVMANGSQDSTSTRSHRLEKAYDWFCEQAREYLDDSSDNARDRARALEWAITQGLTFVVIRVAQDSNASEIFDSLNSRGTPLLTSDQAKNFMYWEVYKKERREPTESRMKDIWPFDETDRQNEWWHQKLKIGRLGIPLEAFLRHWLTLCYGREIKTRDVMAEFRKQINRGGLDNVSKDLKEKAKFYKEILAGNADPNSFLFRWQRALQATTMLPVLLKLRQFPRQEQEIAERYLESYGVRRWICQLSNAGQTNAMIALLQKLEKSDLETAGNVVERFLAEQLERARRWPDDQTVKNALLEEKILRNQNTNMVKMILLAIEQHIQPSKSEERKVEWEKKLEWGHLQIEHLWPQVWKDYWHRPSDPKLLEQIGNLTLISGPLNASLGNDEWAKKRKELKKYSKLKLNEKLPLEWNESTIRKRNQQLADKIIEIWPRPST